jgi:GT2 family glycosyltransferase
VIVCTRGRARDLARALGALGRADPAPGEIVVVDNDPADPATRAAVEAFGGARYVAEPRPGLSVARNAGLRAASGELIAFVDDDTAVHPGWLERLLAGFETPRVLAVTGLVLPAELETRAQVVFESTMGGAGRGYRPIRFDEAFFEPQVRFGVPVWAIGAGANMAFRREAFERVGDFDERLGAGATGCSEDSELWYRVLAAGGECRYVPDSVVLHWHRRDDAALRRQAHDYLRGHVAALFVQYANHGHRGNLRRAALTMPKYLLRRAVRELAVGPEWRTGILRAEAEGYLAGLRLWRLALARRR